MSTICEKYSDWSEPERRSDPNSSRMYSADDQHHPGRKRGRAAFAVKPGSEAKMRERGLSGIELTRAMRKLGKKQTPGRAPEEAARRERSKREGPAATTRAAKKGAGTRQGDNRSRRGQTDAPSPAELDRQAAMSRRGRDSEKPKGKLKTVPHSHLFMSLHDRLFGDSLQESRRGVSLFDRISN